MNDSVLAVIFTRPEDNDYETVDLFESFADAREFMLEDCANLVAEFGDGLDIDDTLHELTVRWVGHRFGNGLSRSLALLGKILPISTAGGTP